MSDTPAAFLSYARFDDQFSDGKISKFREALSQAFQSQTGRAIAVFQDNKDIRWGEHWPTRLEQALAETTVLIPILTPSFFASGACRQELETFLEHEDALGRKDLILPVYWTACPCLENAQHDSTDDLAAFLRTRQREDWRELWKGGFKTKKVRQTLEKMALDLDRALAQRSRSPSGDQDLGTLISAVEAFVERSEALYRDPSLNSFNDQKIRHVRSIREVLIKWAESGHRRDLLPDFVEAHGALRDFLEEADEWGYRTRFEIVPFDRMLAIMARVASEPVADETLVDVDWEDYENPGAAALRALHDEADRLQQDDVPKARGFLTAADIDRLDSGLTAIRMQCSGSRFRPNSLGRKRAFIEEFRTKLNACVVLLQLQQVALSHYVAWLDPPAVFRDRPETPELVVLPSGSFLMGSAKGEGDDNEYPQHEVVIGYRLAVGRYPVTFEEYERFTAATGTSPPKDAGWDRGRRPVINVSWHEAQVYVRWLGETTGQPYRLLSESEWEYAARAGTTSRYWWGDEITPENANYAGSKHRGTTEVGSYPVNPWGLFDMNGNVWEWLEDCWNVNYVGAPTDGHTWTAGDCSLRVLRGGSWFYYSESLRSADRNWSNSGNRVDSIGFRVARTLTP